MANGSATYAGQNLLIPVSNEFQKTDEWVRENVRPQDLWHPSQEQWAGVTDTGRPFPLWVNPGPGSIEPGHFRWPDGAQKWARGYFYVGKEELDEILTLTDANSFESLILTDGLGGTITASVYMLAPVPVSQPIGGGPPEPCYLIGLVDQRYFWQHLSTNDIVVHEGTTTWGDLFDAVATHMGISITRDTIEAAYGLPPREFTSHHEPAAKYLDCLASAVGKKIVVDLDGTVRLMAPATGSTRGMANAALLPGTLHSGGVYQWGSATDSHPEVLNSFLPTNVTVAFPVFQLGQFTDVWQTVQVSAASAGITVSGVESIYTYRSFYPAIADSSGTIINLTAVAAYALQWVTDWYAWRVGNINPGCSGIVPFSPDGLHHEIRWIYDRDRIYTKMVRGHWDAQQDDFSLLARNRALLCGGTGMSEGVEMKACLVPIKPEVARLCAEMYVGVATDACLVTPVVTPVAVAEFLCAEMFCDTVMDACLPDGGVYFFETGNGDSTSMGGGLSINRIDASGSTASDMTPVLTIGDGSTRAMMGTLSLSNTGNQGLKWRFAYKNVNGDEVPAGDPNSMPAADPIPAVRWDLDDKILQPDTVGGETIANACISQLIIQVESTIAEFPTTWSIRGIWAQ